MWVGGDNMGLRFRKSIKVGKNTRINLSKSGVGLSTGVKGARVSVNQKGTRTTLSAPGTGISHVSYKSHGKAQKGGGLSTSVDVGVVLDGSLPKSKAYKHYLTILFAMVSISAFAGSVPMGIIFLGATYYTYRKVMSPKNQIAIQYNKALKAKDAEDRKTILLDAQSNYGDSDLLSNALATIYYNEGNFNSTLKYISKIKDSNLLHSSNILTMFVNSSFQEENYQGLISMIEPIVGDDLTLKLAVALAYKELGQVKKASEILNEGPVRKRTYDETTLTYKYYLGLCYLEMEENQKALTQLKKVYEVDSEFLDVKKYAQELNFALGEHRSS